MILGATSRISPSCRSMLANTVSSQSRRFATLVSNDAVMAAETESATSGPHVLQVLRINADEDRIEDLGLTRRL